MGWETRSIDLQLSKVHDRARIVRGGDVVQIHRQSTRKYYAVKMPDMTTGTAEGQSPPARFQSTRLHRCHAVPDGIYSQVSVKALATGGIAFK